MHLCVTIAFQGRLRKLPDDCHLPQSITSIRRGVSLRTIDRLIALKELQVRRGDWFAEGQSVQAHMGHGRL